LILDLQPSLQDLNNILIEDSWFENGLDNVWRYQKLAVYKQSSLFVIPMKIKYPGLIAKGDKGWAICEWSKLKRKTKLGDNLVTRKENL